MKVRLRCVLAWFAVLLGILLVKTSVEWSSEAEVTTPHPLQEADADHHNSADPPASPVLAAAAHDSPIPIAYTPEAVLPRVVGVPPPPREPRIAREEK